MFPSLSLKLIFVLLSDDLFHITQKIGAIKCEFSHLIAPKFTKPVTFEHIILHFFPGTIKNIFFLLTRHHPYLYPIFREPVCTSDSENYGNLLIYFEKSYLRNY